MKPSRFEKWLMRRFGLTLFCHACGKLTLRDTCEKCRKAIDAYYNARLSIAFPQDKVLVMYAPVNTRGNQRFWIH